MKETISNANNFVREPKENNFSFSRLRKSNTKAGELNASARKIGHHSQVKINTDKRFANIQTKQSKQTNKKEIKILDRNSEKKICSIHKS
jgi:hypothetical protein